MLVCTICRRVWLAYDGPPLCGDTDHVPVQPSVAAGATGLAADDRAADGPAITAVADAPGGESRANVPRATAAVARNAPRRMECAYRRTVSPGVGGEETEEDAWTLVPPLVHANPLARMLGYRLRQRHRPHKQTWIYEGATYNSSDDQNPAGGHPPCVLRRVARVRHRRPDRPAARSS
jgi:hypothetical protein